MNRKEANFVQTYLNGIVPKLKEEVDAMGKDFGNADCYLKNIKCIVDSALAMLTLSVDEPFADLIDRVVK